MAKSIATTLSGALFVSVPHRAFEQVIQENRLPWSSITSSRSRRKKERNLWSRASCPTNKTCHSSLLAAAICALRSSQQRGRYGGPGHCVELTRRSGSTDSPEVEVERSTIYTGDGYQVKMVCFVFADPPAEVTFTRRWLVCFPYSNMC